MKTSCNPLPAALAALLALPASLLADDLYWDSNGATAGFGSTNGTWGVSAFWSTDPLGASATANTPTTTADTVFFGTATLGYTGGRTVTIDGTRDVGDITFGAASGAVTLSGGTALNLGGTTPTITVNNTTSTINTPVDGTAGFTKSGPGILILNNGLNNTDNPYTGKTVVSGGVLQIGTGFNVGNASLPGGYSGNPVAGSNLELNGGVVSYFFDFNRSLGTGNGRIQITGGESGFSQKQGDRALLTFDTASTEVQWGGATFNPSTLILNDSRAGVAAPIRFANPLDLNGANRTVAVNNTTTSINTSGAAIGAFSRIINNGAIFFGTIRNTDTENNAGLIKTGVGILGFNATNTYNGGTIVNQGGVFFNSVTAMPASGVVAVNSGTSLIVTVGGAGRWTTGDSGNGTIGGLLAGLGGQSGSTVTYVGDVTIGLNVSSSAQTYAGDIANATGSATTGITVYSDGGSGVLTLSGANSYTGPTTVRTGVLAVSTLANAGANSNIGAYPSTDNAGLLLSGGTFRYSGAADGATNRGFSTIINSTINIVNAVKLAMGDYRSTAGELLTVSGVAGGSLEINRGLLFTGANINLTSNIPVHFSEVVAKDSASGNNPTFSSAGTGAFTVGNITTDISGGNANVVMGGSGGTITGNVAIGTGLFTKAGGATWTYTGNSFVASQITINSTGGFTVGGAGTLGTGGTWAGTINHGAANAFIYASSANQTLTGNHTGAGNVSVTGSGTLTFSTSTKGYSGTTTVSNGRLLVNSNKSGAGAVNVNGGILGGSASVFGPVTIGADGNIAPGADAAVGTLTFGTITNALDITAMADGAGQLQYDLGPIAASDRIIVAGTLAIGTGALGFSDFDFNEFGSLEEGTYTLIQSATLTGTLDGDDLTGVIGDFNATLRISGTSILLDLEEIPSGSPYGLWSGGAPPQEDTNNDGVKNAIAWALGAADPNENAIDRLPVIDNTTDPDYLIFSFNRSNEAEADTDTAISVEYDTDLQAPWTTAVHDGDNVIIQVGTPGPETTPVTVKLKRATLAPGGELFARLKSAVTIP